MWNNIAKSAEAMFSRWAVKRLCKFMLKKKLGQFILGDIDLDQLDVQLRAGTIHLSDLALNVDFLNQKLGAGAAFVIKEGSIGSLSVTMPWKDRGCEIEVEELELVLAPPGFLGDHFGLETCIPSQVGDSCGSEKMKPGSIENTVMPVSSDVHEGVKTIAKMVKWLLTSFHVKVKKLIVAFDSSLEEHEKNTTLCRTLVLRMSEVQCGTCISEEADAPADAPTDNLLGLNTLTNFVKFQGAMLEFLEMDDVESETVVPSASGTTFGEWFSESCPSNGRTPVITGKDGGFSGTLKLRIPWKNGSLNIRKVDADAFIDPLVLRFQPSSIKWLLHLWQIVKDSGKIRKDQMDIKTVGSVHLTTASPSSPSTLDSYLTSNKVIPGSEKFSFDFCSPVGKEKVSDALLPESQLISDWVPLSLSKNLKNGAEEEPDFGASVEQFFDCLDEMRNSQSALGNSGMWNWTCSVFTAITAASNLASGSIHIAAEQQPIETNLKANVAGISVLFSLLDDSEDQQPLSDLNSVKTASSVFHYLSAEFQDILLVLQASSQQIKFKATVENIELTDNFSDDNGFLGTKNGVRQVAMIHKVQAAIHDTLPPFPLFARGPHSEKHGRSVDADSPFAQTCTDRSSSRTNCEQIKKNNEVKVLLLKTSGCTDFQVAVNSRSPGNFVGASSFSLKLPPVVFWVNFHLINMVLLRLKEFANIFEADSISDVPASKGSKMQGGSGSHGDMQRNGCRYLTALSTEERLRGNIFLPNARIILCFTSENEGDSRTSYCSWNQFIAFNVSSPSTASEENIQVTSPVSILGSQKRYSSKTSQSIHLNMGNLDIYLITSPPDGNLGSDRGDLRQTFSSENILSATNRRGDLSVISMIWQEAPGTGLLIAKSAKHLATSEDIRGRSRFVGRGYEFASVTTAKDTQEFNYHARQEMILSSTFILHVHISPIKIKLNSSQYKILHCLSKQAMERLSCLVRDSVSIENDSSALQTSIIVECGSVDISVSLEPKEITKSSIQNELPGSWQSLRLQIKKFHLLSVSNIGGICGSDFLWFSHAEGSLWGSVTEVPNQYFLLISCSNSTMGRGDGEGSNILFSQFAGSDIIHLWDPEICHAYMSITIRCSTIIAIGGRLDWFEAIPSFFSLPSLESEQADDKDLEYSVDNVPSEFSFVLNLVDVGLSYEPYINGQITSKSCDPDLRSMNVNEGIHRNYFACLLAASSLKLSHNKLKDHVNSDYKVRVQDLGLLLCAVPWPEDAGGIYGAERLHNVGYVKIAKAAHLEAILRMNCGNDLLWELECSESNLFLETCHDTTSGLIDLATQLQQLFAPDMEESAVHLQARWDNVQKAQESDVVEILNNESGGPSTSKNGTSVLDTKNKMDVINLMDEICEDAFHLSEHLDGLSVCHEPELCESDNDLLNVACNSTAKSPKHKLSMSGSETRDLLESGTPSQKSVPEFIEGYFLSELSSLHAASKEKKWQDEVAKYKSRTLANGDAEKVNNGWYGDASFKILEDHVPGVSSRFGPQLVVEEGTTSNHKESDHHGKVRGRLVLKNINVHWRMYAGSDWHKFQRRDQESPNMLGRDRSACLEFTLSKISCQYEVYPEGGISVSRLKLAIQEFNLSDNSKDSPWKMVLGYYQSKDHPRSSSSRAFKLDLEAVRPDPLTPLEEYRLRVAMLPMLLHLHQSQLDFLISFFGGKSSCVDQSPNCYQGVGEPEVSSRNSKFGGNIVSEEALLPFFQKFDLWPVLIRVDYVPCRVDLAALRGGKYVELVNLVPWKGVELQLKHVHAVGLYGWGSVCETVVGEWLEDISQNQIHKLLRGLPPIRSLVAVGSGAAKLVSLPVKNYKKDRRLLKGMQRGTIAFLRSISLEAVGLGVHLAAGAHDILLQAEYILTSVPPSVPGSPQSRTKTNVRSNQPKDVRQGVQQAYESMSDGLGKSASALVRAPLKRFQRGGGAGSAFATAVKAAPGAAMAPASAAACAMHCALLGVRNSLDPEHKKESIEKYLGTSQPRDNTRSINHES